jgi:hypothetical protein
MYGIFVRKFFGEADSEEAKEEAVRGKILRVKWILIETGLTVWTEFYCHNRLSC